jgi:hypothetical protein
MGRAYSKHEVKRKTCRILVGKPTLMWECDIKIDISKIGLGGMDRILLVYDRD